jgi:hypothetical protein
LRPLHLFYKNFPSSSLVPGCFPLHGQLNFFLRQPNAQWMSTISSFPQTQIWFKALENGVIIARLVPPLKHGCHIAICARMLFKNKLKYILHATCERWVIKKICCDIVGTQSTQLDRQKPIKNICAPNQKEYTPQM